MDDHPLDNPAWSALFGPHARFAIETGRFRRYRGDVQVFAAAADQRAGYAGLADVLPAGSMIGLVTTGEVTIPSGMEVVEVALVPQMVADALRPVAVRSAVVPLTDNDVPAMLELTGITHPGPFLPRSIEMGRYLGIFDDGRLVAMAGERMSVPGFIEVSAVCTHPDWQGRGYAKELVSAITGGIVERGLRPFLHVRATNEVAISTYKKLGFAVRREMIFSAMKRQG